MLAPREDLIVLVRGPMIHAVNVSTPHVQVRAEARVIELDAALAAACAQRRLTYCSLLPLIPQFRGQHLPDGIHWPAESHAPVARAELRMLLGLLRGTAAS